MKPSLLLIVNAVGLLVCGGLFVWGLVSPAAEPVSVPGVATLQSVGPLFEPVRLSVSRMVPTRAAEPSGRMLEARSERFTRRYSLEDLGVMVLENPSAHELTMAVNLSGELWKSEDSSKVYVFTRRNFDLFLDAANRVINVEKAEGRWNFESGELVPGMDGYRVDADGTLSHFREAVLSGAAFFDIAVVQEASLSREASAFSDFRPKRVLAQYSTTFSRSKNRTINVKLAASSLNGLFLAPGAVFSYNDVVGERSEARGFKDAPVIEQGQLVEGLGGGACQVSSTVHAASLLLGLNILERYNHSLPSSYIGLGLDAVVSYPLLDMRIKNGFDRPLVLQVTTQDNVLTAKWLGDLEPPRILFRKEVIEEIPFKEIITTDPTLEEGTFVVKKRGKVGYKVQRGRISWVDGKEHFERLNMDVYQSQPQRVSVALNTPYPPEPEEEGDVQGDAVSP